MKPSRMPSKWVKLCPWYYTERNPPSRATHKRLAIAAESKASEETEADELWRHKDCVVGECSQAPKN